LLPQSREANHALNKIEEAIHWAHDAIDRHGEHGPKGPE
jgi:hypothetical protein